MQNPLRIPISFERIQTSSIRTTHMRSERNENKEKNLYDHKNVLVIYYDRGGLMWS